MSGRISLIERRLNTVLSTIRTGRPAESDRHAGRARGAAGGGPEVIAGMYKSGICAVRDVYKTPVCAMRKKYQTGVTSRVGFVQNRVFGGVVLYRIKICCGNGSWCFRDGEEDMMIAGPGWEAPKSGR
jgi:hypothetical protein